MGFVSYRNVEVHHLSHGGGRSSITEAFTKKGSKPLVKEIVEYIKTIPDDEGILMFTFIPKMKRTADGQSIARVDFEKDLRKALDKEGIDTKKQKVVDDRGELQDRFAWLTHGNETSVSKYRYCKNQVWVGVLYHSLGHIAASITGQRDDITTPLPTKHLHETSLGEVAYAYHQGFGRGPSRVVKNGVAGAQKVFIVLSQADVGGIRERLEKALPDLQWHDYAAKYIDGFKSKQAKLADQIAEHLEGLEANDLPDGYKVSTAKLKRALGQENVCKRAFTRAADIADKALFNWNRGGRSFVYTR